MELEDKLKTAKSNLLSLQQGAPDVEAAHIVLKTIESEKDAITRLREEKTGLDMKISILSSNAVEENLRVVKERRQEAQNRLKAIKFDIAVYKRLLRALKAAQDRSRDRYVAPVHAELSPLLRMICPDAQPTIDPETGLITKIARRDLDEDFDILSWGTQEQISLMVQLAFAQMLAKAGRPALVILDDAIVHTDDDRIEQMFNALTRQAEGQQIIVFSCRQRTFRFLGGESLAISHPEVASRRN